MPEVTPQAVGIYSNDLVGDALIKFLRLSKVNEMKEISYSLAGHSPDTFSRLFL